MSTRRPFVFLKLHRHIILTGIQEEKERLGKADKEAESSINLLDRCGNNVQERIENMKELTAYLKRANPEEVIDIRLKLREAPRRAIDEITVFAMGFRNRKHMNELTSKDRWKVYSQGIDNKD
jgi:hypothetical protein